MCRARIIDFIGLSIALTALNLAMTSTTAATEEPRFELLAKWDERDIEIRRYVPRVLAVTPMATTQANGFQALAGYIFGGNSDSQKMAMTAPVQTTFNEASPQEMAFVMPAGYDQSTLPKPTDPSVTLRSMPSYVAAVIRFSGRAGADSAEAQWQELRTFLGAHGIILAGQPTLNQYNPPWTPGFMRRNEIIVPVEESSLP